MHPEADAFLDAIFDNPDDDTPRLVYADWLQEHGQENYAQFIRLQCADWPATRCGATKRTGSSDELWPWRGQRLRWRTCDGRPSRKRLGDSSASTAASLGTSDPRRTSRSRVTSESRGVWIRLPLPLDLRILWHWTIALFGDVRVPVETSAGLHVETDRARLDVGSGRPWQRLRGRLRCTERCEPSADLLRSITAHRGFANSHRSGGRLAEVQPTCRRSPFWTIRRAYTVRTKARRTRTWRSTADDR